MRAPPRYANEPLAIALRDARPPLVLAIDIGTSGLRTFLFDVRGRPVGSAIAHRDRTPRTAADGEVMAVRHRELPVDGVQFHPESVLTLPVGRDLLENFLER